jgi:uncharacterized protein YjbI with pentapeptide repeats
MGWIDPVVSYASPPRLTAPEPRDVGTATFDDASDSRWECVDRAMTASVIDLDGCDVLEIENSTLDGVTFMGRTMPRSTLVHSVLVGCDLSGARFDSLRTVRFVDCKLVGADFAGAEVLDVSFHGCVLRIVNLRMAKLRRVEFVDCTLHDVDAHGLEAEDVSFVGSDLERVNIDRMRARRVDLRAARRLGLEHVGSLNGCLIGDDQLTELSYQLAFAAGLAIERDRGGDASPVD